MQKYKAIYKDGTNEVFENITDMEIDADNGMIILKILVDTNTNIAVEGICLFMHDLRRLEFNLDA